MAGSEGGGVLRAKYLDWCSAKIAERFLALSPDEIYQLAERATHGQPISAGPLASLSSFNPKDVSPDWLAAIDQAVTTVADVDSDEASSFRNLVARVTEVLADEMELPTLEEWGAAYSEAPEEFDKDLLGYWKE
ncbi:MAG TPA: hypothetical protein VM100_08410 [Longimicrobiales bacterium]|nr:hypothetical protein [Longimicrobiales bacterium]